MGIVSAKQPGKHARHIFDRSLAIFAINAACLKHTAFSSVRPAGFRNLSTKGTFRRLIRHDR